MKKKFKKKTYKFLFFISLFLITITSALVNISASGIEYGEEDTIFTFDLNRDYLDFIDNNFPNDFNYYFTLPISFTIGNTSSTYNNLSVRITNGNVVSIWFEGISNLGIPIDIYLVESGIWNDDEVLTDVVFSEGISVTETYIEDLYNFNFQYNDIRDFTSYVNRFYQYVSINNLLFIKLNTYRWKNDITKVAKENDSVLKNISMVYINQTENNNKIVGFTIGDTILDDNGNIIDIPMNKISFMSNNEKYNEIELNLETNNNEFVEYWLKYNNFVPYEQETGIWLNNNYKFLTLYNQIGLMDYLNMSIYGDFNVAQFWVDPNTDATFNDLFTGIANVPIIVLSNLLSFSIFGWTGFAVLTGIVTLLLIIWLIRKLTK